MQNGESTYTTHPDWREHLARLLGETEIDTRPLWHTAQMLRHPRDKAAAYRQNGAAACDMESGSIAREAARAQVPFVALRAVCDPADRILPRWIASAIHNGGADVALGALTHPGDWATLYRLARDLRTALRSLERAAVTLRRVISERILQSPPQPHH